MAVQSVRIWRSKVTVDPNRIARLPFVASPGARRYALTMVQLPRQREAVAPETFRPWVALRTVVMAADTLWIGVFVALSVMHGATRSAYFSSAFFIALFSACAFFYNRLAFTVSDSGLTVRTLSLERTFRFEDILRIDVSPGFFGTSYAIRTRGGPLTFSSLLAGHQRLCSLIVGRANLT